MQLPHAIHRHLYATSVAGLLVLDGLFFTATNTANVPSFALAIGFLLVVATVWVLFFGLFGLASMYGLKVVHKSRLALYASLSLGLVVALQSIGELSQRDILVLIPLVILGYGYSAYTKTSQRNLNQ